jgi:hypothetical protein
MAETIETNGCDDQVSFTFDELSDEAKERALNWVASGNCQDWEPQIDWEAEALTYIGIGINASNKALPSIEYSVGSYDDCFAFEGTFRAAELNHEKLLGHVSADCPLHAVFAKCMALHLMCPDVTANIYHSGRERYSVASCSVPESAWQGPDDDDLELRCNELLDDILKAVNAWMLAQLQADYEWQSDRDRCIEDIEANEYKFDEDGEVV